MLKFDKPKMMYIMHVSWFWIKQRPHFIAEHLVDHFKITVFSSESVLRNKQLIRSKKTPYLKFLISFPLQRFKDFKFYKTFSDFFIAEQLKRYVNNNEYLWFTSPLHFIILKKHIKPSHIVIYDCMDDFLEFPSIKKSQKSVSEYLVAEQKLLQRSNFVFATSHFLKNKLINRYEPKVSIWIINNAISNSFFKTIKVNLENPFPKIKGIIDLVYIGTISHWFNFDLIIESLNHFMKIRYILIGPKEMEIPNHERLIYIAPVKHDELTSYMKNSDALIMPFIVTDLIKSVNPVKLYEYIYSGKPIITCSYSEIDQFDDFVHRYSNKGEYLQLIEKLINSELKQKEFDLCQKFALKNTWKKRVEDIIEVIGKNANQV